VPIKYCWNGGLGICAVSHLRLVLKRQKGDASSALSWATQFQSSKAYTAIKILCGKMQQCT